MQINFHGEDVNKYRYIQTPIELLIFEVIGHVYPVQCEVLLFQVWVQVKINLNIELMRGVHFIKVYIFVVKYQFLY